MRRRLLSLLMGLALASTVWAFDSWPQWQGPNRNSASPEKGLLDRWNGEPPLVWKTEGLGDGYAGPVVQGSNKRGIVCTMGDRDGLATVAAFSAKDGKELWSKKIAEAECGWYTGSKSTPTMDGDRVYAVDFDGHLVCLKATTGELIWEKNYKKDFEGRCRDAGPDGYSESPLIDGDKLICTPGGAEAGIVALDKMTGKELWRCAIESDENQRSMHGNHPGAVCTSPVISNGAGVKQYVQLMAEGLVGVDAKTGKQLWINYDCTSHYGIRTLVVHGDYVLSVNDGTGGRSVLLKLSRKGKSGVKAKKVYALEGKVLETMMGNSVLVGDYLYTSHHRTGGPQCIEFLTGKIKWEEESSPGSGSAAIVYADGHLYYHYVNGVTLLVAATPDKYELKGEFQIPRNEQGRWSHPAISNGRLYLRSGDILYCYNLKKKK